MRTPFGRRPITITVALVVSIFQLNLVLSDDQCNVTSADKNNDDAQCHLYMAPSGIPNAGHGVYTTRPILATEEVLTYADVPNIIVPDVELHHRMNGWNIVWNHVDYVWDPDGMSGHECNSADNLINSLGSLCNSHTPWPDEYDDTRLDRFSDPGAGSISYYEGQKFYATQDIAAGDELFTFYGEKWLDDREGTYADDIPRREDFTTAVSVIRRMHQEDIEVTDDVIRIITNVVQTYNKRVSQLLPHTATEFKSYIFGAPDTLIPSAEEMEERLARSTVKRPDAVNWIREHGLCLDNIRPGNSTIPGAGRGAFAKRFLPKESMVVPVPLLNIPDKTSMLMYPYTFEGDDVNVLLENPDSYQLLVNYCFSHTDSSLMFCSQSNSLLINHCGGRIKDSEGECGDNGPNARVKWTEWDGGITSEWLNKTIDEIDKLTENGQRGLMMEVVATRDIYPGEEVFIDYGVEWEESWRRHIEEWEPPKTEDSWHNYVPVRDLINSADFRTLDELKENPYPSNIQMFCYYYVEEEEEDYEEDEDEDEEEEEEEELEDNETVEMRYDDEEEQSKSEETYKDEDKKEYKEDEDSKDRYYEKYYEDYYEENNKENDMEENNKNDTKESNMLSGEKFVSHFIDTEKSIYPCDIMEWDIITSGSITSGIVRIHPSETIPETILINYPVTKSVTFRMRPYTSDQFLPGTFRQFIGINDDMFPESWKIIN